MNFITFNWLLPTVNETTSKVEVKEEELRGIEYWQKKSLEKKDRGPFENGVLGFLFPNLFKKNEVSNQIRNMFQ